MSEDGDKPRGTMSAAFWVMLAFSLACIIAGIFVARFGPALFPAHPRPTAAAPQLGKPATDR